jgi:CDP-diacylglycerol--glycerol-3-phosphate 3-phosphatidyltransferase
MLLTIPNQITLARIASVPLFMFLVLSGTRIGTALAIALFSLAAISDAVDGYLARSFKQTTLFGKFADPIADKLLVVGALVSFVQLGELTAAPVMVIVAREFLVTGLRIFAIAQGEVVAASLSGKLKTISQIGLVLVVLTNRYFAWGSAGGIAQSVCLYLAVALSLASAGEYFYRSRRLFA